MNGLLVRALAAYDARPEPDRRQASLVLLAIALFFVHYAAYSVWYIEDAAISFAYARHLATGDGPVAYVGGEPVQGFSNPTWTLLLAAAYAVGIDPFAAGKLFGALFGALALPAAWAWGRAVLGPRADLWPAVPAVLLAVSPQHVLWAASGLENSVVNLALAAGAALVLREVRRPPRIPWSAVAWGALALSRPEGPAYAALGVGIGLLATGVVHGPRAALGQAVKIGLISGIPFVAWHAWALWTFAWEAPMTYYAKLGGDDKFQPLVWEGRGSRGWRYLRGYALTYGHGFALWLYGLGLAGFRGWRLWIAAVVLVALHLALLPGIGWLSALVGEAPLGGAAALPIWPFAADGETTVLVRVAALGLALVGLPLLGLGRPGQTGRLLAAALAGFAIFFALYAGGDWMKGHRWLATAAVPLAVLFVDAAAGLGDAVGARWRAGWGRALVGAVPVAAIAILAIVQIFPLVGRPETRPYDVGRRVAYGMQIARKLGIERPVMMDVDMGAHVWWAGEHAEIVDIAGLVDVSFGVHTWQKPFVGEYVYAERNPDLAHVHGSWASRSRLRSLPGWRQYVEVAPYPSSPYRVHEGNHVRRDLLVDPGPFDPAAEARFASGLVLRRVGVPASVQPPGGELVVELAWTRRGAGEGPRQMIVFVAGGGRIAPVADVPGNGFLPYRQWKATEAIRGRHFLRLPADLPPGRYDLGVVVIGADGRVDPAEALPAAALRGDPAYARGEVRFAGAITVVDRSAAQAIVTRAAAEIAELRPCADAEARWSDARLHLPPEDPVRGAAEATARERLADCYRREAVDGALSRSPRPEIVASGAAALRLAPRSGPIRRTLASIAANWFSASRVAEARGELDEAYGLARDGLRLDPTAAWERRRAERLRDRRLGLEPQATWFGRWLDDPPVDAP